MGWLGPILDTRLISVVLCFNAVIAVQINYWSIKNKKKLFSNNLNIWFVYTKKYSYHSWSNTGVNLCSLIGPYRKTAKNFSPWKIWKLPRHNTNMFFQPMSDIYTLIMGLLAHSWFKIMEFSQVLVIPAFWHWKIAA